MEKDAVIEEIVGFKHENKIYRIYMTMDVEDCHSCVDCSVVMKSKSYKRCYACNYRKKNGCDIPANVCPCGVSCKTFKHCYQCHVMYVNQTNV